MSTQNNFYDQRSDSFKQLLTLFREFLNDFKVHVGNPIEAKWLPKRRVQQFLGYGDTQFAELLSSRKLIASTIGRRKFVSVDSLLDLLEGNIDA